MCFSNNYLQALEDKEGEVDATVHFVQRGVQVLERSRWWFGGVSTNFELVRYRYDDECMHDAKCWILG
jgi:hypothetical protein